MNEILMSKEKVFFIWLFLFFLFMSLLFERDVFAVNRVQKVQKVQKVQEKVVGVFYFNKIFGHVHESASVQSGSLTVIQCSHPLKVIESPIVSVSKDWLYVGVGKFKGFVKREFLSTKRPRCFQAKYPKFFDEFKPDLSDLYYWGRLYDHLQEGETRVK